MHKFFRFGLPLGSSIIVVGLLHWFSSVRLVFLAIDAFFPVKTLEREDYVTITCSLASLVLTLLLWTQVILRGKRHVAFFWFAFSILNCTVQIVQAFYDLSYHSKFSGSRELYGTIWGLLVTILLSIYIYIVTAQMITSFLIEDELNSFRDILRPLGTSCFQLVEYYQIKPSLGSRVMLTADAVWSAFILLVYELPHYGCSRFDWLKHFGEAEIFFFPGTAGTVISAEEIWMRGFRVLNGIIGCYLVLRRTTKLKPWLFFQLCGITASIIMYIILFAMTKSWASQVQGYIYQLLFTSDIVFRFAVLHFCIEFKRGIDVISLSVV